MLLLIAFIAVVTFIRAFDKADAGAETLHELSRQSAVESVFNN